MSLPRTPAFAAPDAIRRVAGRAEMIGFDRLWVGDRLLTSLDSHAEEAHVDPIGALHIAATATSRIGLAAALVAPWHPATLLARSLATLDLASEGRLTVGLTTGSSVDEYDAAGVPLAGRTARLDESLDVLEATWRSRVVAYEGRHVRIPPSFVEPKPQQRPRPAILLGGTTPDALERVARRADGWLAPFPSVDIGDGWATVRDLAATQGRDPDGLQLVIHLDLGATPEADSGCLLDRGVAAALQAGAHELVVRCPQADPSDDDRMPGLDAIVERVRGY